MDGYFILTAFVVIDKVMAALGHRDDMRAGARAYEWEGVLTIPNPVILVRAVK